MALFPFSKAQRNDEIIRDTCKLYRISLLKVLPISLCMVAIYHLILFGQHYIPAEYSTQGQQLLMFIVILLLPLFAMSVAIILNIAEGKKSSYALAFKVAVKKFIPLIACLISMSLFPVIVLTVGIVAYFLIGHFFPHLPIFLFFALKVLILLAVFTAILTKATAPILLFSENNEVNTAVDIAEQSIKMAFCRTFLFTLYGFSLLWFVAILPSLFQYYFKAVTLNPMVLEGIAEGLLVILLPWVIALLIVQAKDLYIRWEEKNQNDRKQTENISLINNSTTKDNNISF
jgi:hypothetical protein